MTEEGAGELATDPGEWPKVVGQVTTGGILRYVVEPDGDHVVVINTDGWSTGYTYEAARWMRQNAEHVAPVADTALARAALAAAGDLSDHVLRFYLVGYSGADFDADMDWFSRWEDGWDDHNVAALAPGLGTAERARDFVHRHRLPDPRVRWVSVHGSIGLVWEDPDGGEWQISFGRDGSVIVDAEFLVGESLGELPVEREVAAAVALIHRWNGVDTDAPIPGIDTPLVVVSVNTGSMVEDYLFDYAARTVERFGGGAEEDLADVFSSMMRTGTEIDLNGGVPVEWSWHAAPGTLADDVEAAGFDVVDWHIWGDPDRETPSVGVVDAAEMIDTLRAEVAELEVGDGLGEPEGETLVEAAAFPSTHELPSPAAARRRATGVDLEWDCEVGVVTVRFRNGKAPEARLATIWGVDSDTFRSSDPLVRQINRALRELPTGS